MSLWKVLAGSHGEDENNDLENGLAIIGFKQIPNIGNTKSREEITEILKKYLPDAPKKRIINFTSQLHTFVHKIKEGDLIVLPLKTRPYIAIGKVKSPYKYRKVNQEERHTRMVEWLRTDILRTAIGQDLLLSLSTPMTICQIKKNNAEERFNAIIEGKPDPAKDKTTTTGEKEVEDDNADVEQIACDQIRSYLEQNFKGHDLERLVNAILQAEGYITDLVDSGPDGGVDILAGKSDLGFGSPKICVQVKSSDSPVDVNVFRNLQGVLKKFSADYGLLVSWGGFNRAVEKEARQSYFQIRLWDQDDILKAIERNYDKFPEELQKELPLKRIWVLVSSEES